jgi:hypothetical protein
MTKIPTHRRLAALLLGLAGAASFTTSANAITLPPDADAAVVQLSPHGSDNYGGDNQLQVSSAASDNRWFFLKFDTGTGGTHALPSGTTSADISRVTLTLYVNLVTTATMNASIDVYRPDASWTEGRVSGSPSGLDITWSNKPNSTGSVIASYIPLTTDKYQFVTFDITNTYKDWVSGTTTNNGLLFKPNTSGGGAVNVQFPSKENTDACHQPFLDIVLSNGGNSTLSAITGGTWTGANSITTLGTVTTGTWNGSTIAVANGGTGSTTAGGARGNLGLTIGSNVQGWNTNLDDLADGSLTGSKVGSGISAANITTGTLSIGNGGTGQTSASGAINALVPSQAGNTGKALQTDGTSVGWVTPVSLTGTNTLTGTNVFTTSLANGTPLAAVNTAVNSYGNIFRAEDTNAGDIMVFKKGQFQCIQQDTSGGSVISMGAGPSSCSAALGAVASSGEYAAVSANTISGLALAATDTFGYVQDKIHINGVTFETLGGTEHDTMTVQADGSIRPQTTILFGSSTLNFGNIASLGSADLTITVTGAVDGDAVSLGVPNSSQTAGAVYSAFVSAADTVTVRFFNASGSGQDPASGTFNVRVHK